VGTNKKVFAAKQLPRREKKMAEIAICPETQFRLETLRTI
jgi:hypothetical protein